MKKCAGCGKENLDNALFCAECGSKLDERPSKSATDSNKCPKCGKTNLKEATFCSNCGAKLNNSSSLANSSSSSSSSSKPLNSSSKTNFTSSYSSSNSSNANSRSSSKSSSSSASSKTSNQQDEGPSRLKICCCYVPVVLFVAFIVFALIYHGFAESFPVTYGHDYDVLDLNGDGRLSYFEASQIDTSIPNSTMKGYFNDADTNHNGFLKGHEFELFYDNADNYYTVYSSSSSSDDDKYKYSSSSSSSSSSGSGSSSARNSLNDQEFDSSSEGYVLTCPYCGSEAIYETGGYYKCAECGSSIYNPDDLELNYQEGYMDLSAPVCLAIS